MNGKSYKNIPKRVLIVLKMDKKQTAMTPKEKAEELFDKYRNTIVSFLSDNMKDQNAKQCALIAVEEILDMVKHTPIEYIENEYWEQVKQEIEKP